MDFANIPIACARRKKGIKKLILKVGSIKFNLNGMYINKFVENSFFGFADFIYLFSWTYGR